MKLDTINSYYNDFVFWMSKSLKTGWGIDMKTYPFPNGIIVVINMERGTAHKLRRKEDSSSLGEALRKTKLFIEEKIRPIANKRIEDTMVGIISTTKYILFKNTDDSSWSESSAQQDVENIIKMVKTSYVRHS